MQVVFTPCALRQLDELHRYITGKASEAVADGYIGRITAACERLDLFPHRGMKRDDVLPGLRLVGFERRATIAFAVMTDVVVIEGVFHGGQDVIRRLSQSKR